MAGQQRFWCPKSYVYGAVSENLFVPAMDTLRAVIFRARQLFLCCPVNGGLTYRLPNAKFVHSGNFGGCGLEPLLLLQEAWACLLPVRTEGHREFESG